MEKLNSVLNFMYDNKDSDEIIFFKTIQVTEIDLITTKLSCDIRKSVNDRKKVNEIAKYKVGNEKKDYATYFMSLLTETQLSFYFFDLYTKSNKHVKVKTPPIAAVGLDKDRQDFHFDGKSRKMNFDLKSQFWKCSTDAVNINYDVYHNNIRNGVDFFVAGIIEMEDYENLETSKNVSYYIISNKFIETKAKLINGHRGLYYSIDLKHFKQNDF